MKTLEELFARPQMMSEVVKSQEVDLETDPWTTYWTESRLGPSKKANIVSNMFKGMAAEQQDVPLHVGTPKAKQGARQTPVGADRPSYQGKQSAYKPPDSALRNEVVDEFL